MKIFIFFFFMFFSGLPAFSQLKISDKCPEINVDLLYGVVNQTVLPSSDIALIKHDLPCFTSSQAKSDSSKCGAMVSYKDKDIYFYTDRDYVEIGPNFKGKLSLPLMGAPRTNIFQYLGAPQVKETGWEAFKTSYGLLILYYSKDAKVDKIQFSTKTAATIQLCQ